MLQGDPFWPQDAAEWVALLRNIVLSAAGAGATLYTLLRWRILEWIKQVKDSLAEAIEDEREAREAADMSECKDRKTADKNIDERVQRMAQDVHNYMGKLDLLQTAMHAGDLERAREMGEMRTELRAGFAKLEALVNKQHGDR